MFIILYKMSKTGLIDIEVKCIKHTDLIKNINILFLTSSEQNQIAQLMRVSMKMGNTILRMTQRSF